MLHIDRLQLTLGRTVILQDLSFQVPEGSLFVIIGPNGSGKSSLLRCISGWNQPTDGSVLLESRSVQLLSAKERAACLSFLPQRPHLSESIPILTLVAAARYRFSETHAKSREAALEFLQKGNIGHLQNRNWHTLSGGEAQRVALTCMRAQDSKIWLLDEPANHLDPAVQREMYRDIITEWKRGRTLIVVTHNINLILGAVPTDLYSKVHILGLMSGKKAFSLCLSDPEITDQIGSLYQLPVQRVSVFDRDHLIFGDPS